MELYVAVCKCCGGNINLDKSREAGYCPYCGTKYYTDKYNESSVDREAIVKRANEILKKAKVFLGNGDWDRARNEFYILSSNSVYPRELCDIGYVGIRCSEIEMYSIDEFVGGQEIKTDDNQSADMYRSCIDIQAGLYVICKDLEGDEFELASEYFHEAYDKCPINPFCYIAFLMLKHKIKKLSDINRYYTAIEDSIEKETEYQKAYEFADDETKEILDKFKSIDEEQKKINDRENEQYEYYYRKLQELIAKKKELMEEHKAMDELWHELPMYEEKNYCFLCGYKQMFGTVKKCKKCGAENSYGKDMEMAKIIENFRPWENGGNTKYRAGYGKMNNADTLVKLYKNCTLSIWIRNVAGGNTMYKRKVRYHNWRGDEGIDFYKSFYTNQNGDVMGEIYCLEEGKLSNKDKMTRYINCKLKILPVDAKNGEYSVLYFNGGENAEFYTLVNGEIDGTAYLINEWELKISKYSHGKKIDECTIERRSKMD